MPEPTFTRERCLASMKAAGCREIGGDAWTDGTYRYVLRGTEAASRLVATRVTPARDANQAMRDAMRPLFLDARRTAA